MPVPELVFAHRLAALGRVDCCSGSISNFMLGVSAGRNDNIWPAKSLEELHGQTPGSGVEQIAQNGVSGGGIKPRALLGPRPEGLTLQVGQNGAIALDFGEVNLTGQRVQEATTVRVGVNPDPRRPRE
jgi:hypothetical protein